MLNFAEQTGSSAVMIVWSFLANLPTMLYMYARKYLNATESSFLINSISSNEVFNFPFQFFRDSSTYLRRVLVLTMVQTFIQETLVHNIQNLQYKDFAISLNDTILAYNLVSYSTTCSHCCTISLGIKET